MLQREAVASWKSPSPCCAAVPGFVPEPPLTFSSLNAMQKSLLAGWPFALLRACGATVCESLLLLCRMSLHLPHVLPYKFRATVVVWAAFWLGPSLHALPGAVFPSTTFSVRAPHARGCLVATFATLGAALWGLCQARHPGACFYTSSLTNQALNWL